jgi:arabinogalactan endo-1,4-beta-galactosidase
MKKALSLLMAALFLVLCLPVTALAEGKTPPGAIYGNYDKEATAYIWQFGEMAAGESPTAVSYSDAYASIRAGLAAGDSISSGGIAFTGAGCLEPNDTKGFASAAESGRYLLVRPAVSGTLEICVRFDKASNTRKCRIYYQDLGELDSVEAAADLSGLNKNETEIGTATTSDPVTWQLSLTAGHVYGFVTYNDSPAQITALRLLTTEVPGGPGEGGEEGGSGSGEMPAPAGDAVTGVWDDSHTAYRWTFGKTTAVETSAIYDAAPSGGNAPALCLGMAAGDHTDASGLHLAGYGVSDDGITAASTGRYLLVKPAQNGTIQMSLSATLSGGKPKARIYTADLGEVELAAADLTQLQKAGDPLAAVETTSGSDSGTMSLQAGHVYGFAVYAVNASDILLYDLSFTPKSDQPEPEPEPEPEPKPEPEPEDPYKPSGTSQTEFTFEESDTAAWTLSSASVTADAHGGSNGLTINKNGSASITVNDLPQGSYTVSLWAKGSASGARMSVSGTGGPDSVLKLDNALSGQGGWVQAAHRNVLVYNGQMTLTFVNYTDGLSLDDIQITLDANDNNPVSNWDFESGLDGWETSGTVALTDAADTGSQAVQLADQSEVHQTISVQPDTDYIATVRMKVDVEDTFTSTEQYSLDGSTLMGLLVERTSTGNRVNLGVRGVDGTVLRQAPSATAGYSLVTIAFHTGPNQTQVELYANTIFDEAYKDSVTVHENTFGSENPYPNGWQRPDPDQVDVTHLADGWTSNGSRFAYVDNFDVFQVDNTYIKGADMSFLQVIEDCGGKYFANGVQQDALRILSNHGVNSVLGMIFVHSGNEVYTWDTLTHLGTSVTGFDGEYVTGRQQVVGYFDETHTTALALRCQELGMTFTPSFHYSDTWISAAKAHMPYEWLETDYEGNLSNPDIEMLGTAVYNYVYDFLTGMKEAGVDNVITVKNGNEQNGGLLFPVASGISQNHAAIITASSRAVRQVYPGAINTIHTNTGYDPKQLESFFGRLLGYGAEFDGMGFSLYGGRDALISDLLREEWGFDGYFVSDCGAVKDFHKGHKVTNTVEESAALALTSGCDLNCGQVYPHMRQALAMGLVTEEDVDAAVTHLMMTRMRLGMFDKDCPFDAIPYEENDTPAHHAAALTAAEECLVLLKNDGLLPLDAKACKTIAVIGPNADTVEILKGNYNGTATEHYTLLDGIRAVAKQGNPDVRIMVSAGCHLWRENVEALAEPDDRRSEAVAMARRADVVILCIGLNGTLEGEEGDANNSYAGADKADLLLPLPQRRLIQEVAAVGKPIVLINATGSAMALGTEADLCNAVLQTWYPGQMGGLAVGRAIFGQVNPSGKLPVTFYRTTEELPPFTDYAMQGRTYRFMEHEPLYPFGYGLSYSTFAYTDLTAETTPDGGCTLRAVVTNMSRRAGTDVAQVYVRLIGAAGRVPNRSLTAFRRVTLEQGQIEEVTFTLPKTAFAEYDALGREVYTAAEAELSLGGGQPDARTVTLTGAAIPTVTIKLGGLQ